MLGYALQLVYHYVLPWFQECQDQCLSCQSEEILLLSEAPSFLHNGGSHMEPIKTMVKEAQPSSCPG